MKMNKVFSIIFVVICFVLVLFTVTGCAKNSVDEEYAYNTEIETNENKPVAGEVQIDKIQGYVEDKEQKLIELPYSVKDTDLEVVSVGKYSGFIEENGTLKEVEDIFALVVKNKSEQIVSYSSFTVEYDKEKETSFSPTNLPSGMSTLVFCSSPYVSYEDVKKFQVTDSLAIMTDSLPMLDGVVGVDFKDGEFIITNLTDEELGDVYVRYKSFSDGNIYLGGTTYSAMVEDVMPYETYKVAADSYVEGKSVIIAVESIDV